MQLQGSVYKPESWVGVGAPHLDVGHYCWNPSTATGSGQKKSLMAVCHCELCAGPLTEDQQCWTSLCLFYATSSLDHQKSNVQCHWVDATEYFSSTDSGDLML